MQWLPRLSAGVTMNPQAELESARAEAEVRRVWLAQIYRNPFARITAKTIAAELPYYLPRSTISWHMGRLRRKGLPTKPIIVPSR